MTGVQLVGRAAEIAEIEAALASIADGPTALHLQGAPGIGKTSLLRFAEQLARARGMTVLACRRAQQEVRLAHSALFDVLEPLDDLIDTIPAPQRDALAIAFGRRRPVRGQALAGPRLLAAATLELLRGALRAGPVLLVADDVQWMDRPSLHALDYAVRRATGPLLVVTSSRGIWDGLDPADLGRARTLTVQPLTVEETMQTLVDAGYERLPLGTLRHLAFVADGNPFYALELARAGVGDATTGSALPPTLQRIVDARVARMPAPVRRVLATASALSDLSLDALRAAEPSLDVDALLAVAEDADLIRVSRGRFMFTHPVVRAGVYARCTPPEARELHRRLARVETEPASRALHLAQAVTGPDPEAVSALDDAAEHARSLGETCVASDLLEVAIRLGADDPARVLAAARDQFAADDHQRALELVEQVLDQTLPDELRAQALAIAGAVRFRFGELAEALAALEPALELSVGDDALHATVAQELGIVLINVGRLQDALDVVAGALGSAERLADTGILAELLGEHVLLQLFCGGPLLEADLERALRLEDPARGTTAMMWPSFNAALIAAFAGQMRRAYELLSAVRTRCLERGQEGDVWIVEYYSVLPALRLGRVEAAEAHAAETERRAHASGSPGLQGVALAARADVHMWTGDITACLASGRLAVDVFESMSVDAPIAPGRAAMVRALTVQSRYTEVVALLAAVRDDLTAGAPPHRGHSLLAADLVEALAMTGDLASAADVVEWMRADVARSPTPCLASVTARAAGILAERSGDLDGARRLLLDAVTALAPEPDPYEAGRAWLTLSGLERRDRRRHASRDAAGQAAEAFASVGSKAWEAAARTLAAPPVPLQDELTAMERRVCELSSAGMTNRAVAERLGMSAKTVEAHLTRAFRKLAIRSRAELGRAMASRTGVEAVALARDELPAGGPAKAQP